MHRDCTRCRRPFGPADLSRADSKNMEHDRKAAGLTGVRFLYYRCPGCGADDIFVDILPLPGESEDEYRGRQAAMEGVVRGLHDDRVDAVVVPVKRPG